MIVARASCTAGPRGKLPRHLGRGAGRAGWLLTIYHHGGIRKFQIEQQKSLARGARPHLWRQTLQSAAQLNGDGKGLRLLDSGSLDEQFDLTLIEFAQRSQACRAGAAHQAALRAIHRVPFRPVEFPNGFAYS
jgi:hypothetical protein